jgi:AhpD family alkylhydroperoxidase
MRIQVDKQKVQKLMKKIIFFMKLKDFIRGKKFEPPADLSKGIPQMHEVIATRPDIARKMMPFQKKIYFDGEIERELKEKIFVKVSKLNKCQFCTVTHERMLTKFKLEEEGIDEREKVALEYAEQVTLDANAVTDELYKRLKIQFNDSEIIELTLAIGLINLLNQFNNAFQVRAEK